MTEKYGISNYLRYVNDDFLKYVEGKDQHKQPDDLCEIKRAQQRFADHDEGVDVNYGDKLVQGYYLLRYAYAYVFEYRYMYNRLFDAVYGKTPFPLRKIDVTSIGCGSMLDYFGLCYALDYVRSAIGTCCVNYTGLDIVYWNYKFGEDWGTPSETGRKNDHAVFVGKVEGGEKIGVNAADVLREKDSLDSNIYFFPKSMGDIAHYAFEDLVDIFNSIATKSTQDVLYIMISRPPKADPDLADDSETKLEEIMGKNNFHCSSEINSENYNLSCSSGIDREGYKDSLLKPDGGFKGIASCSHGKNFQYPLSDICFGNGNSLAKKCQNYDNCTEKGECEKLLKHNPAFTTVNVCFKILTYERK